MRTSKGRSIQRLTVLLLAAILSLALAPAALADTGESTPKITGASARRTLGRRGV